MAKAITKNRLKGFKNALAKHKVPVNNDWIKHCDFNPIAIDQAILSLFTGEEKPDAIMASVERVVMRCVVVLKELNLRIPQDCALIGFSDNPLNNYLNPSLSSISQPTLEIGKRSAELLIDLIESKSPPAEYQTLQLETILNIRDSSTKSK